MDNCARNVFISFRFRDGKVLKDRLSNAFENSKVTIDCSEDQDRSKMLPQTIQEYLYKKLAASSVTIVILTPLALSYEKENGKISDWIYDETRYSLEDRGNNRTNGLIALYTKETQSKIFELKSDGVRYFYSTNRNLCEANVCNANEDKKKNKTAGLYDSLQDSYCSFVDFDSFISNIKYYIDNAVSKRERIGDFEITKKL
jgi:hypothetical protein